ncbi:MAG: hypothetical protein LBB08_02790 [Rickettsiales bacterium]|nr:hypothetical protein [Rickettsiales bacterium]
MNESSASVANTLIAKLPQWYLELIIPALIIAGIWILSRMRRDNSGKRTRKKSLTHS